MNQSSKVIPAPHPAMPPGEQEVRAALSQLRQKLLDLTARNPLISFKHGKSARYIRIVDELPDRLTEELYAGKSLKFSPISEPDASELASWSPGTTASSIKRPPVETWAAHCGISVSPDLPSRKGGRQHQDLKVQTPYYPNTLESRLANLTKLAHTTV